jgi:hypothetical protein
VSPLFFRVFQHLLPRALAWRVTIEKNLRRFFEGLSQTPADAKEYVDKVWEDAFPSTTRELEEWEKQFGLQPSKGLPEATRRSALAAEWAASGGQSPGYIQGVLQAAGFPLYVHEWWDPASLPTFTPRNPLLYTAIASIGTIECSALASQPQCSSFPNQPQCNAFLANPDDIFYVVNDDLTQQAPPPVPDDPFQWPFFLYIGAETFPDHAEIPLGRKAELRRLVLKLKPAQQWIVLLVDYEIHDTFDDSFDSTFD